MTVRLLSFWSSRPFTNPLAVISHNDIAHGWMTVPYFLSYARYVFSFPPAKTEKQGKPLWLYVNAV